MFKCEQNYVKHDMSFNITLIMNQMHKMHTEPIKNKINGFFWFTKTWTFGLDCFFISPIQSITLMCSLKQVILVPFFFIILTVKNNTTDKTNSGWTGIWNDSKFRWLALARNSCSIQTACVQRPAHSTLLAPFDWTALSPLYSALTYSQIKKIILRPMIVKQSNTVCVFVSARHVISQCAPSDTGSFGMNAIETWNCSVGVVQFFKQKMTGSEEGLRFRRTQSVTRAEEIQAVEQKVRKSQPDKPYVKLICFVAVNFVIIRLLTMQF